VLDSIMHLGASHLYALLAHMEQDSLVRGHLLDQGARPPRRVLAIFAQRSEKVKVRSA
jgi:DNA-binding PadR family transcriptional regulator